MKCTRCGFENPDYLEFCQNCSAQLPKKGEESNQPSWGFVKAPKWAEPDFSADTVSEDDVPADFVSDTEAVRRQQEAARRAAAEAAALKARRAAEAAAAAKAAEETRAAERYEAEQKRLAEEKRAAERRAEQERLLAERKAAELEAQKAQRRIAAKRYEPEDNEEEEEEEETSHGGRAAALFGSILQRREKPARDNYYEEDEEEEEEEDDFDEYDPGYARKRTAPRRRKTKSGGSGLNLAIRIAAIVAVLALLAIAGWLLVSQIKSCVEANQSPTGTNKAPTVVKNTDPKEPDTYLVTVYAKNGKVLVYETSDGTKQSATVKSDDALTFKVHEVSLMPNEPVDSTVYQATPKVFIQNEDGTTVPVEGMPSVTLSVPAITVTYDCEDSIVSDDGNVTVSGRIDFIGTDLTIDGEKVAINQDGSFSRDIVYEDTGSYTVNIEGRLAGHQVYRHTINVEVEAAHPTESLIKLPWEYGDTSYRQRVVNSVDSIEVRGMVPVGSTLTATCDSSDCGLTEPSVADDGTFTLTAKLANPSDYTIHLTCTTESGQISERDIHVQRQPEMSQYIARALEMNYASFAYESRQAYNIKGTVTEILQEGDYYLAMLETEAGDKLVLEYHNHYGSAAAIEVGKTYEKIYGRPMGLNEEGIPQAYVWFIND